MRAPSVFVVPEPVETERPEAVSQLIDAPPTALDNAGMTPVPQRPRLSFAVGVTGHRPNKLKGQASARAESQLAAVFAAIDAACSAQRERDARWYQEVPHRVRLVSSFAEGADQLAVKMRPAHWEVTAVLPFPRERYEEDFVTRDERGAIVSDRRLEFLAALREAADIVELAEGSDGAPAGYARAGAFSLRQIDLLIAVWDGGEAAGKGGTAHVVAQALEGGIPVVWIASTREQAPWLIERLADVAREAPLADATLGPIAQAVEAALALAPSTSRRLADFFAEGARHWQDGQASAEELDWSSRLGAADDDHQPCSLAGMRTDWEPFLSQLPEAGRFKRRFVDVLLPRFVVAEALAGDYGRAWRNGDLVVYLLALLAIAIALVGVSPIGIGRAEGAASLVLQAGLAFLELLVVGGIVMMVRMDERQRRRERASDYRALAEGLRHLRFLAPIGECANHWLHRDRASKARDWTPDWVLWYLRATIRELGTPSALLDGNYQSKLLLATEAVEIDQQIARQEESGKRLGRQQLLFLHASEACFLSTAALLTIFLTLFAGWLALRIAVPSGVGGFIPQLASWDARLWQFLWGARPFLALLAALLPAAGAILAGLRLAAGYERAADRSVRTAALLQALKTDYAVARERLELDRTAVTLLDTAKAQAEMIEACRSLYRRKRLTLPV